jgi:DNA-binding transcriptional regulator YbjK
MSTVSRIEPPPQSSDRPRLIAKAAARVIGRDGLAALSHRAVAREAGVPLTAVPYYYGSKDALLVAAVDHITETELSLVRALAGELTLETVTPREAARAVAELLDMLIATDRGDRIGHLEAMLHAARQDPPLEAPRVWWQANCDLARTILEEAGQADPELDARLLFAAGFGLYFAELVTPSADDDGQRLTRCLERLFQALDTREGHARRRTRRQPDQA